jgi:hypothetical protein
VVNPGAPAAHRAFLREKSQCQQGGTRTQEIPSTHRRHNASSPWLVRIVAQWNSTVGTERVETDTSNLRKTNWNDVF